MAKNDKKINAFHSTLVDDIDNILQINNNKWYSENIYNL
jgi:hypothetical protein